MSAAGSKTVLKTRRIARLMKDHGLDLAVIGNGRTAALCDPDGTPGVVVLSALRQRSGLLPPGCGRRGERICRRRARTDWSIFSPNICATPLSCPPCSPIKTAARSASPTLHRGIGISAGFSARRSSSGSSSRSQGCRALPSVSARRMIMAVPFAHHSMGSNHIRYLHEGIVIRLTTRRAALLYRARGPVRAHPAGASRVRN